MSDEQKLTAMLVKMDNLEERVSELADRIDDKPCPSPACLRCQERIADLEQWRVRRETEIGEEQKDEECEHQRESWVVPMVILGIIEMAGVAVSVMVAVC